MGRGSSGNNGETPLESWNNGGGAVTNVEDLKNIKDRKLYQAVTKSISRMYATLGMKERQIKLADIGGAGIMGIQFTSFSGDNDGIFLQKSIFKNATAAQVKKMINDQYDSGWQTRTNQPVGHVITHELSHALWNSSHKSAAAQAAGKEIYDLYKTWWNDKKSGRGSTNYGKYAATNRDEFFAEVMTKAVHGTSDKYTKRAVAIIKKHKLNFNAK